MQQKTQEVVLARPSTRKPVSARKPAVIAKKVVKVPGDEGVSAVEWPVVAAKPMPAQKPVSEKKPATGKKIVEKKVAPVLADPAPVPVALPPVEPAVVEPEPVALAPVMPEPVEDIVEAVATPPVAPDPVVEAVEAVFEPVEAIVTEPAPVSPETAAEPAALKKGPFIMTDAMETAKTYAEEAKNRIQSAVTEMNDKAKVAMEKSAKAAEELGELTKGNLEAIVESSKIAAKGVETLGQEAVEFGRKSIEKSTTTFKSFAAVKSPTEFFQLQSELMSATMDSFASEAAKSSEAMLKLFGDVSKPISNRVAIVSDKIKALAA